MTSMPVDDRRSPVTQGLLVTAAQIEYIKFWCGIPNVMATLRSSKTILKPIVDSGELRVVLLLERAVDCKDLKAATVTYLLKAITKAYTDWLTCLSGYNGFRASVPPVKLHAIVFKGAGSYSSSGEGDAYASVPKSSVANFTDTPLGKEASWFYTTSGDRRNTHHLTFAISDDPDMGAGNAQPQYVRLFMPIPTYEDRKVSVKPFGGLGVREICDSQSWFLGSLLEHEVGHTFFLDDMYDPTKYPVPLRKDGPVLKKDDTIMYDSVQITDMDRVMLRVVWDMQSGYEPNFGPIP